MSFIDTFFIFFIDETVPHIKLNSYLPQPNYPVKITKKDT